MPKSSDGPQRYHHMAFNGRSTLLSTLKYKHFIVYRIVLAPMNRTLNFPTKAFNFEKFFDNFEYSLAKAPPPKCTGKRQKAIAPSPAVPYKSFKASMVVSPIQGD